MKKQFNLFRTMFLVVFIFSCTFANVFAQDDAPTQNSVYGTFGIFPPAVTFSLNYDHFFVQKEKIDFGAKAIIAFTGVGDFDGGGTSGRSIGLGGVALISLSSSDNPLKLELNGGILFGDIPSSDVADYGMSFIGLRLTKNRLMLRGGIGLPGLIEFGMGLNF